MINEGVTVLMIVNLDSDSGGACLKKAAAAGIKSIDYDRLTLGGGASYYVSFDNVKVGKLDGPGPAEVPRRRRARPRPTSSTSTVTRPTTTPRCSSRATMTALKPKIDSGDYKLVGDQSGFWDADEGRRRLRAAVHPEQGQDRRRRLGQRHDGRRHHRPAHARTASPARCRSPVRTPASVACSRSSLATSA